MANPNPNEETRFKPGISGNPTGKTSEQKTQELRNAEKAAKIRGQLLEGLGETLDDMTNEDLAKLANSTGVVKMLKDSEDRGFGAPVQSINNPDGSLRPQVVELVGVKPDAKPD